jgi:hypothetical protein
MKKLNRALSIILVVTMALCLFAVSAYADGDDDATGASSGGDSGTVTTEVPGGGTGDALGGTDPAATDPAETPAVTDPAETDPAETDDLTDTMAKYFSEGDPITSLPITKNLVTAYKDVALPQEDFYIQMVPADNLGPNDTYGGIEIKAGYALKENVLDFHFDANDAIKDYKTESGVVTKTDDFDFDFVDENGDTITFSSTGIYRYYITEVVVDEVTKDDEGNVTSVTYKDPPAEEVDKEYYINYDRTTYVVDLFVNPITGGGYGVTNLLVTEKTTDDTNKPKPESISFTNTIKCSNIKISKVITKNTVEYTKNEDYTFYVLIPEAGDTITLTDSDTIQAQRYNSDGSTDGDPIILQVKGANIDSNVVENGTKITMKQGQYVIITAPVSMIYKVQEVIPTEEGYSIEATYQETGTFTDSTTLTKDPKELVTAIDNYTDTTTNKEMMGLCVRGTTNTDMDQIVFTNKREAGAVTGINLDIIPYVAILILAVAGCAVFIVRKSRKAR